VLEYNDDDDTQPDAYSFNRTAISKVFRGNVFSTLTYDSMSRVELYLNNESNVVNVLSLGDFVATPLPQTLPVELLIESGGGDDDVIFGAGDLNPLVGAITLDGGAGLDEVLLDDSAHAAAESFLVTTTAISRAGFGPLAYSGAESIALNAGTGADSINLRSATIPVTLNGGGGNDAITLGPASAFPPSNLGAIDANVSVDGGAGADQLNLNDQQSDSPLSYQLSPGFFDRTDFPRVSFAGVEVAELGTGSATDQVDVVPSQDDRVHRLRRQPDVRPGR
jgi:hypothetical protein